jgi:hypothetical protein
VDILLRVRGECVGSGGNTAETVKLVLCYWQELQIFSLRLEEVALHIPLPREVYLILWESIIQFTCSTFVEGWVRR